MIASLPCMCATFSYKQTIRLNKSDHILFSMRTLRQPPVEPDPMLHTLPKRGKNTETEDAIVVKSWHIEVRL